MTKRRCRTCDKPLPIAIYGNRKYCDKHAPKLHRSTFKVARTWVLTEKAIREMNEATVAVPLWLIND